MGPICTAWEHELDEGFLLSVTHQSANSKDSWLYDQKVASDRNAEVLLALKNHCYTSPIPLKLDGLRLDGLQHCPGHGWHKRSFPVSLCFTDGELPQVQWPSGTFETLADSGNHDFADGGGLEGATRKYLERIEAVQSSSVAAFISARVNEFAHLGKLEAKNSTLYGFRTEPS